MIWSRIFRILRVLLHLSVCFEGRENLIPTSRVGKWMGAAGLSMIQIQYYSHTLVSRVFIIDLY
jgi:hypothetical protein